MSHYVCSECGVHSKSPGVCQNDNCIQQGLPLKICNCEDGKHSGVMNSWKDEPSVSENTEDVPDGQKVKTLDLDNEPND